MYIHASTVLYTLGVTLCLSRMSARVLYATLCKPTSPIPAIDAKQGVNYYGPKVVEPHVKIGLTT